MSARIERALLSVSDKTGLVEFARGLRARGVELLSTGGTAKALADAGLAGHRRRRPTPASPRCSTAASRRCIPKVHGGILARRDLPAHRAAIAAARHPADRPRRRQPVPVPRDGGQAGLHARRRDREHRHRRPGDGALGGQELRRTSASSSIPRTTPRCSPSSTPSGGALAARDALPPRAEGLRAHRAPTTARSPTGSPRAAPDGEARALPGVVPLRPASRSQPLRYGENPHQRAAFYRDERAGAGVDRDAAASCRARSCPTTTSLDADAAWDCVKAFDAPGLRDRQAHEPLRRGGRRDAAARRIATRSRPIPRPRSAASSPSTARSTPRRSRRCPAQFLEVLIAPAYAPDGARRDRAQEERARARDRAPSQAPSGRTAPLGAAGLQARGRRAAGAERRRARRRRASDLRVVTKRAPTPRRGRATSLFAWRVAKHVKSNAIVFCGGGRTLGIGAGQMSRVDSTRIAALKANSAGLSLAGSVVASDAFFPFRDGLDVVADNGARGGHPARRQRARRRGHRGRRRASAWRWCSPACATSAIELRQRG